MNLSHREDRARKAIRFYLGLRPTQSIEPVGHKRVETVNITTKRLAVLASAILVWGCTSVTVRPVDRAVQLKHVCIQENPKVWVKNFLPVLRDGFERHGISSEVFSGPTPDTCEFIVTYTARQSWDFANYLTRAELSLEKEGQQIAFAEYHLKGGGGFSLMKWQGTKTKMDPLIDELLVAYR